MKSNLSKYILLICAPVVLGACEGKEPLEEIGYISNERAIEVFRVPGQIGSAEITRTPDLCEVHLSVMDGEVDLSRVTPEIMVSIGATVEPASGKPVDFASNGGQYTYVVTSETGLTRQWTVYIESFRIPAWMDRTWIMEAPAASGGSWSANYTVKAPYDELYPGNNPLGWLTNHLDTRGHMTFTNDPGTGAKYTRPLSFYKFAGIVPSIMDDRDNTLKFNFTGFSDDMSSIVGTYEYGAGEDGRYTAYPILTATANTGAATQTTIDLGTLFRPFPTGTGKFEYEMDSQTLKFLNGEGEVVCQTDTRKTVIANNGSTVITFDKGFVYDEQENRLQLHFKPIQGAKIPGAPANYTLATIQSTQPLVNLSLQNLDVATFFQLVNTDEVWMDFVPAE